MKISCAFPPSPRVVDHIVEAERLGYERAWLFDSPALYNDIWMIAALAAQRTERIGLGPAVLVPNLRHPLAQASAIATLEQLAPGRAVVAIGTGFTGRLAMGQKPLTWAFTRRYIEQLRALLRGEQVEVDGAAVRMVHGDEFAPKRPIMTPIVIAANGPKGLAVARDLGDGVMTIGSGDPSFEWCAVLAFGTVLDDGEDAASLRALEAAGPALTVVYHAMYEGDPASVDALPGGVEWRAELEKIPKAERHLATHEDHLVRVTERDRPLLNADLLRSFTWTASAPELRGRLDLLEAAGATEILYQPMGPDVPRELRAFAEMAGVRGVSRVNIDELLERARRDVESGWLPSCQLAVAQEGELVAFETFGAADNDTRYCIFSCTKPIVASAVWLLIGDGLVDVARPVSEYVPEFAVGGKEAVTVEQCLLHTAGFPNAVMLETDGADAAARRATFADWQLEWEPGSRFEYHATSAHWVLADIIERVGGMDFRDFVEQRVCAPLGLPRLLGIPIDEQCDIAKFVRIGDGPRDTIARLDRPEVRAAGVPGGGAIMRAADLALFYQGLLHNPGDLWDAGVLHDAKTHVRCTFPDDLLHVPVNRTLGLVLAGDDGQHFARYGSFGVANSPSSIGHAGAHMHLGWADPQSGLSFAYCTNGLDGDVMKEAMRGLELSNLAASLAG